MYDALLSVHSVLRWVVLALGLLAFLRAFSGLTGRKAWTSGDDRAGRRFAIGLDVQALAGFVLYLFLSPVTTSAFGNLGAAMASGIQRYWTVEHLVLMIGALALAHIGRARSRKLIDPAARHRAAAVFFGASLALALAGIPWPFSRYGRPLLPF